MYVFWWTGRGYLALLTLIGVFGVFGVVFGDAAFEQFPWLWGIGALLAAAVTWVVGCRINKKPIRPGEPKAWRGRLVYRARNRFVSLPVETWAVPMTLLGLGLLVRGFLPR